MRSQQGFFAVTHTCPSCRGQGREIVDPCHPCGGQGRVRREKEIRLGFPGKEEKVKVDVADGAPVPWGLADDLKQMGKDHPRVDALLKVTGQARYSYDMRFDNLIYATLLRSPHACAEIKKVDLSRAKALKGVLYTESMEGKTVTFAGAPVAGVGSSPSRTAHAAISTISRTEPNP